MNALPMQLQRSAQPRVLCPARQRRCVYLTRIAAVRDGRGHGSHSTRSSGGDEPWREITRVVGQVKAPAHPAAEQATPEALTVYTVRLSTSQARGSTLSDPYSRVNICLIAASGQAFLHSISPIQEPHLDPDQLCTLINSDNSVGADCRAVSSPVVKAVSPTVSSSSAAAPSPPENTASSPKLRFQQGSVDEVSVLAPELGPLVGLLVGTEGGSWRLAEVNVVSSRTSKAERFVCGRLLGASSDDSAGYLLPVPAGCVVIGSGEDALVMTKAEARALRTSNLRGYDTLKGQVLRTTAVLAGSGATIAGLVAGPDAALPFLAGGGAGVLYQWLLQQGVDSIAAGVGSAATSSMDSSPSAFPSSPASSGAYSVGSAGAQARATSLHAAKLAATQGMANGAITASRTSLDEGDAPEAWRSSVALVADIGPVQRAFGRINTPLLRVALLIGALSGVGVMTGGNPGVVLDSPEAVAPLEAALSTPAESVAAAVTSDVDGGVRWAWGQVAGWQYGLAALGFFMQKVALVSVALAPGSDDPPPGGVRVQQYQRYT